MRRPTYESPRNGRPPRPIPHTPLGHPSRHVGLPGIATYKPPRERTKPWTIRRFAKANRKESQ